MGDKSAIEWTDATWNPVTGCTKVSQGCKHCYAERVFPRVYGDRDFTDVRFHADRITQPLRWRRPRRIFVNSMSDVFHEALDNFVIGGIFETMLEADWHTYQVLSKRPQRMLEAVNGMCRQWGLKGMPPHIWLGVSVEDQATADERIPLLLQTPAVVRFLACEPLLGPIKLGKPGESWLTWLPHGSDSHALPPIARREAGIDWVIAGGESGPRARPSHPDWFRALRDQCQAAGVPFFFKQWGDHLTMDYLRVGKKAAGNVLDGRTWEEYPA